MISWKYSFEEMSKDLELAKKKKQALEDLFNAGKISESTYESLSKGVCNTISEIEKRQKDLAEKMTSKLTELEQQINTLEMFLANSEIQHVAGEIDDELHERESKAFSLGLDALRQQLDSIKGIVGDILPEFVAPTPPSEPEEIVEAEVPSTEEVTEEMAEISAETPVEEAPVEVPEEAEAPSEEIVVDQPTEAPVEVPVEGETVSEEVAVEEPSEALGEVPIEEAPVEDVPVEEVPVEEAQVVEEPVQEDIGTLPEVPTEEIEERFPSPEEAVEEPEVVQGIDVEEDVVEAPTEEETETLTEEATEEAYSEGEEEATTEEETE